MTPAGCLLGIVIESVMGVSCEFAFAKSSLSYIAVHACQSHHSRGRIRLSHVDVSSDGIQISLRHVTSIV